MINLIKGDCLAEMKKLEEKSVDLVIADLPYGKTKNKWDSIISFEEMWKEIDRIAKDNVAVIFFFTRNILCRFSQFKQKKFQIRHSLG